MIPAEAENALIDMGASSRLAWRLPEFHASVAAALIEAVPRSRQRDIDRWNPRVVLKRWVQTWA